ncbi:5-formyltetrahydrofolate cyclo-ligase [Breznakiella homolactica]|uniref:5-formyltetrahydrofolate cyclo-ligase n=1 Tax=Breznakiella homolactica TaxID=2798577 RepID=A0A7T7XRD9_9SPIR|nr:5-formyltetrahydrofolate cyclo-ligase [Breznakiella homolactica]QQO11100.1 5-formyltetrahydrofolate cyclo-ligase [Breznakiella homolactica]
MDSKKALRNSMLRRLASLDPGLFRSQGRDAASLISSQKIWLSAETVLLFMAMEQEIDTEPLLARALEGGKRVFIPKVAGPEMRFYRIQSARGPWLCGPYGIREPDPAAPDSDLKPEDFPLLIIVPGVAFDRQGNRLGRGKAYYDRFFASLDQRTGTDTPRRPAEKSRSPNYYTVGLCMDEQVVPAVPADSWDRPMDAICTGSEYVTVVPQ